MMNVRFCFQFLLTLPLFHLSALNSDEWYTETLHQDWRQKLRIDELIYAEQTPQQDLIIFRNKTFGTVLALDGVIQTTEADEFFYHEMMTHVPLLAHTNPKKVLIIGGGDGGILREVARHTAVDRIVLVEIDDAVVAFSQKYLPSLSNNSFKDHRLELVIQDGYQFVKNTKETFDVIICDSTDPVGPGKVLFTEEFYGNCHRILNKEGILVNQNGVPFLQVDEFIDTFEKRKKHFNDVGFYLGMVPTYVGGFMAIGWATDAPKYRQVTEEQLKKRLGHLTGTLRYYTPAIHKVAFTLPKFMEDSLNPGCQDQRGQKH